MLPVINQALVICYGYFKISTGLFTKDVNLDDRKQKQDHPEVVKRRIEQAISGEDKNRIWSHESD